MADLSNVFWDLLVGLEYWFNNLMLYILIAMGIWAIILIPVVFDHFNFDTRYGNFASRMLIILGAIAFICSLLCAGRISILGYPSIESVKYTFFHVLIYVGAAAILWLLFNKFTQWRSNDNMKYEDARSRFLIALLVVAFIGVGLTYFHIGVLPFPI